MTIPERLVALRKARGWSREKLAEELGRPSKTVRNYETGDREPGLSYIVEIARVFNVSTDYILGLIDLPVPIRNAPPVSGEAMQLVAEYDALDKWGKKQVRSTVTLELDRTKDQRLEILAAADSGVADKIGYIPKSDIDLIPPGSTPLP